MPDLIGTKSRIHFHKSADRNRVPNFSYWSGELGFEAFSWFPPSREVETRGEGWVWLVQQPPVTMGESAIHWVPWPGHNIQLGDALKTSKCPKIGIGGCHANKSLKSDWDKIRRKAVEEKQKRRGEGDSGSRRSRHCSKHPTAHLVQLISVGWRVAKM